MARDKISDGRELTLYLRYGTLHVIYDTLYDYKVALSRLNFLVHMCDISLTLVDYIFGQDKLFIVTSDSALYCRYGFLYLMDVSVS